MKLELKFNLNQDVWIIPFECFGYVVSLWICHRGTEYEVIYYLEGEVKSAYFREKDLSEKKV